MPGPERVRTVGPDGLSQADATEGIVRELAFGTDRVMLVRARVAGGVSSGWHHHGDREVLGYVLKGRVRAPQRVRPGRRLGLRQSGPREAAEQGLGRCGLTRRLECDPVRLRLVAP